MGQERAPCPEGNDQHNIIQGAIISPYAEPMHSLGTDMRIPQENGGRGAQASEAGEAPTRPPLFVVEFGAGLPDVRKQVDEFLVLVAQSQTGRAGSGAHPVGSVAYFDKYCIDKTPAKSAWRSHAYINQGSEVEEWVTPTYSRLRPRPLGEEAAEEEEEEAAGKARGPSAAACFNCGSTAHSQRDCPNPRDDKAVEERRKAWQRERGPRPSWASEPRYWDKSSDQVKSQVDSVVPGRVSQALAEALGISPSLASPPQYYLAMAREGYPPGYVGVEERGSGGGQEDDDQEDRLVVYSGDVEMEVGNQPDMKLKSLCTTAARIVDAKAGG